MPGLPNSDSAKENGLPNSDSANAVRHTFFKHTFLKDCVLFGKSEFANPLSNFYLCKMGLLMLYFFTVLYAVTKNPGCQWNDENIVLPDW